MKEDNPFDSVAADCAKLDPDKPIVLTPLVATLMCSTIAETHRVSKLAEEGRVSVAFRDGYQMGIEEGERRALARIQQTLVPHLADYFKPTYGQEAIEIWRNEQESRESRDIT